jgi:polysaccharide biosynthesis protein PslJ
MALAVTEMAEQAKINVRRPDAVTLLSLYLLVLVLLPEPLVFGPLGGAGSPASILAAILLIYYLMARLHPSLPSAQGPQPIRHVAIAFGCSIVATYVSINRHPLSVEAMNGADRGLILVCGWLGILLIAVDCTDRLDRLDVLIQRIVLGAAGMAAIAATQFFTGLNIAKYVVIPGLASKQPIVDIATRDMLNRPFATAGSPIELAAILALCLPLAIHYARFAPPKLRARKWIQVTLIAMALPMTLSRTAIIAVAAAALVLLPTWPRRDRWIAYLAGGLATIAMWAIIPGLLSAFTGLFSEVGNDPSSASRTGAFASAVPFIAQHPWLGVGFDTFFPQSYFFTDDQYLHALIETGAIGLLALLLLFFTGWFVALKTRKASIEPRNRDLAQCLAAAIAADAAAFATLDAFSFTIVCGITFILLGSVGALRRMTSEDRSNNPQRDGGPGSYGRSDLPT